ncbi:prephenate dehydratase [Geoglobus acetivorans]|uniref:Prephenate dehydrogenase n=1 Tax=Geoglobus acetivorans TaxID=565033 RepID=A0A0A7GH67_GEOAI|nr:chorismate mutase/prephenate dehydratase [Geoglobus acetivorans]
MRILVFGHGGMGRIFRDFFEARGYYVRSYDVDESKADVPVEETGNFDVVFLCVPMDRIEEAVKTIVSISAPKLVVDISSVKKNTIDILEKYGLRYLSIHPMFGPGSDLGLSNIIVVRKSGVPEEKTILDEFRKSGAVITEMSVEEHDRRMAEIQGVAHFVLFLFALSLKNRFRDDFEIASPVFLVLHKLASRIINQNWEMYYLIQKNAEELRKAVVENAKILDETLSDRDRFRELVYSLRDSFRNFRDSTLILESYKATVDAQGIDELRGYIRALDSLILELIERRVNAGRKVAMEKIKLNEPIEISRVEDVKMREILKRTGLNPVRVSEIFEKIMELTKEGEYRVLGISRKVAVLGPMGSFSEEAALRLTGSRLPLIYKSSVDEIFRAVEREEVDCGIVPIENSTYGTVLNTLDALLKYNVQVFGEYEHDIRHNLAARRDLPLKEIKTIYSHPQAIAQCSEFINNYLPHAEIRYTRSTSEAVEMLDDSSAAIVSELAARLYRLHVIKRSIQTANNNRTRFYLIRKTGENGDGDITSLFFGVEDEPGALFRVLEVFYRHGINLRKLESRPAGTKLGDYVFFAEAERKLDDSILSELKEKTAFCRIAGIFRKIDKLDVFSEQRTSSGTEFQTAWQT